MSPLMWLVAAAATAVYLVFTTKLGSLIGRAIANREQQVPTTTPEKDR